MTEFLLLSILILKDLNNNTQKYIQEAQLFLYVYKIINRLLALSLRSSRKYIS